jgi:hypothetical protein
MAPMGYSEARGKLIRGKPEVKNLLSDSLYILGSWQNIKIIQIRWRGDTLYHRWIGFRIFLSKALLNNLLHAKEMKPSIL